MVQSLLGLSELPEPHDAADALAVAVCHALKRGADALIAVSSGGQASSLTGVGRGTRRRVRR